MACLLHDVTQLVNPISSSHIHIFIHLDCHLVHTTYFSHSLLPSEPIFAVVTGRLLFKSSAIILTDEEDPEERERETPLSGLMKKVPSSHPHHPLYKSPLYKF
eukprot:TRINITY_DN1639_c0_g1_i2.p1 TRINITY_DN1639_c0_g1~~TRINITY_DN1639_c0_g1_i2.p1  ORF type:complete len:103 (-),score=9.75 TRINITY_DN1639_c0_g1_i2:123-431(-)